MCARGYRVRACWSAVLLKAFQIRLFRSSVSLILIVDVRVWGWFWIWMLKFCLWITFGGFIVCMYIWVWVIRNNRFVKFYFTVITYDFCVIFVCWIDFEKNLGWCSDLNARMISKPMSFLSFFFVNWHKYLLEVTKVLLNYFLLINKLHKNFLQKKT